MAFPYKTGEMFPCSRHNQDAYIWIPKNGTSTLRSIFGTTVHDYTKFNVETFWVILRDPIDRWKSGIVEYIRNNPSMEQLVFDRIHQIRFDGHTAPQTEYLQYTGRTKYILLEDPDWVANIINNTNIQIDTSTLYDNATKSNPRKVEITNKLEDVITESLIDKVTKYYAEDIDLIKRVKNEKLY